MKTVFVNYYFYPDQSATSRLLQDLALHLSSCGMDVRVVTSRRMYDDPKTELPAFERIPDDPVSGVKIYRINTLGFSRRVLWQRALDAGSFYFAAFLKLFFLLERGDRVVVETDPPLVSFFVMIAVKAKGAVLINWLQDLFPETTRAFGLKNSEGLFTCFLRKLRNVSLQSARVNVAISKAMAVRLAEQGVDAKKISVIPNWSDGAKIKPVSSDRNSLRREWGLQNKFVVGYSGNMGLAHEFQTILDSAESLKNEPALIFLFIGDGPRRKWLETEVKKRGLSNFLFKPYQPECRLSESLSLPDVHIVSLLPVLEGSVVPSKFYGIVAAGRPVVYVGSDNGEIARLVRESDCGYTVTAGDFQKLAGKLLELSRDGAEVVRMGRNARFYFEKKWDMRPALAAWKKILTWPGPADKIDAGVESIL